MTTTKHRTIIGWIIFGILFSGLILFIAWGGNPNNSNWYNIRFHNDTVFVPDNALQENIRTTSPQADSCIRAIKMKRKK